MKVEYVKVESAAEKVEKKDTHMRTVSILSPLNQDGREFIYNSETHAMSCKKVLNLFPRPL